MADIVHSDPMALNIPFSNGQLLDEQAVQQLEVQGHAAAVQLFNRGIAVAHLRAELAKPRGKAVRVQSKAHPATKMEQDLPHQPGVQQQQQHAQLWQTPLCPTQHHAAAPPVLVVKCSQLPDEVPTLQSGKRAHTQPSSRNRRPYRPPDASAPVRWLQDVELGAEEDGTDHAHHDAARHRPQPGLRMAPNPALQAQQLAGWTLLGADGEPEAPGGRESVAATTGAANELVSPTEEQQAQDDFMDEEEWI